MSTTIHQVGGLAIFFMLLSCDNRRTTETADDRAETSGDVIGDQAEPTDGALPNEAEPTADAIDNRPEATGETDGRAEVIGDADGGTVEAAEPGASEEVGGEADGTKCVPPCPPGSECVDRDGVGAWECLLPSGDLACLDWRDCPLEDGLCIEGRCVRACGCVDDYVCGEEAICVTEDTGCGICVLRDRYACNTTDDCRWVVDVSRCCRCPKPRNAETVQANPCLVPYPPTGDPVPGCEPDCSGIDHCWPCPESRGAVECVRGLCRLVPAP